MQGHFVPRKAGWDTHGLPVEIEVEKQLGISGKQDIERLGVRASSTGCAARACSSTAASGRSSRSASAYWLDYEHPYVTYTTTTSRACGGRCGRCTTRGCSIAATRSCRTARAAAPRSRATRSRRATRTSRDPSVYVALDLARRDGTRQRRARASSSGRRRRGRSCRTRRSRCIPTLAYVELRKKSGAECTHHPGGGARGGRARAPTGPIAGTSSRRMTGSELAGMRYRRPLDWVDYPAEARTRSSSARVFVSADDGSGVVHMAPAFGADDYAAGQRHGLAFLQPVNGARRVRRGDPRRRRAVREGRRTTRSSRS